MHLNFRIALSMTVSCSVAATFKSYLDRNGLLIANSQILSLTYALRVVAKKVVYIDYMRVTSIRLQMTC